VGIIFKYNSWFSNKYISNDWLGCDSDIILYERLITECSKKWELN